MEKFEANKHPDSDLDFGINWGDNTETGVKGWLNPGEIVVFSSWKITAKEENPVTLVESIQGTSISLDGKITAIFLKGGKHGTEYVLENSIRTIDTNGIERSETKLCILICNKNC